MIGHVTTAAHWLAEREGALLSIGVLAFTTVAYLVRS